MHVLLLTRFEMRVLYNLGIINFEIANTTSLIISARIIFGPKKGRL